MLSVTKLYIIVKAQVLHHPPNTILDFRFWIVDFGVQFDKLTVRAVTEPVEVQSNDFGF